MSLVATRARTSILVVIAAVVALLAAGGTAAASASSTGRSSVALHRLSFARAGSPPSDATCVAIGFRCYSPYEIRRAYGLTGLIKGGISGRGQTVVIVESYGSPTMAADLARFDADYGLPAPPSLKELHPFGKVAFDPSDDAQVGWAMETSLDVQWAHSLAPGASIVVMTSPVAETEGIQGLPQFLALEKYAVRHHLGHVISQSWAATENTLTDSKAGRALIRAFNRFYEYAGKHGISILSSTGDSGSANPKLDGTTNYPFPTVNFPASSPWITAVGGTSLYASTRGVYQHETAWNSGIGSATGGGVSAYQAEPWYQRSLPATTQKLLGGHRAIPDVAFNADPSTGVPVYLGFLGAADNGYFIFGGTSEGAPAWAGIVADLDQGAGRPLGFLNPGLYALGAAHALYPSLAHDVTVGNNAQRPIAGFYAHKGWDAATGWGTPNLAGLAPALIKATS